MTYDNYFTLLGLEVSFEVNQADLEQRYFKLQQQFHPDRFVTKPTSEKVKALQVSTDINAAYQTLKDPLSRAVYMISMQGIKLDGEKPSQELLMQAMEDRESLMNATNIAEIALLSAQNDKAVKACIDEISKAFQEKNFPKAALLAMKLKYLQKFTDEIRIRKQTL